MECLLCGPERWIVGRGPIYTERLFGAAMKKTIKTLFLVLRFFMRLRSCCVYFLLAWSGLFCRVLVPGTLAGFALALYLD